MTNISEIQTQFLNSIFNNDENIHPEIKVTTISAKDRMKIYKNSTFAILIDVLKNSYPVLYQLVGEDFFKVLATNFIKQNPPNKCDITNYGWDLPKYLSNLEQVKDYPYFADIATLEKNRQQAYYADEKPSIHAEYLINPPANIELTTFDFQPHVSLQKSDYAIYSIWLAHQNDEIPEININSEEYLLTYRYAMNIFTMPISLADFTFLSALKNKETLQNAVKLAQNIQDTFTIQNIFMLLLKNKLLIKN